MAEEKKKMNGGVIAAICILVVAAIAAIVAVIVINVTKPNVVGKYSLSAILDSEGNESQDSLKLLKALGADYKIEFKDDKTGVLKVSMDSGALSSFANSFANELAGDDSNVSGSDIENSGMNNAEVNFTYDDKKLTTNADGIGTMEMDYEFKDGTVVVTYSGQRLKFTKDQQ